MNKKEIQKINKKIIELNKRIDKITFDMIQAGYRCIAVREESERQYIMTNHIFNCDCFDCFINKNYY